MVENKKVSRKKKKIAIFIALFLIGSVFLGACSFLVYTNFSLKKTALTFKQESFSSQQKLHAILFIRK